MSGEQVEMVSEAAEMVEFAIRGFAFVSSLFLEAFSNGCNQFCEEHSFPG
jgi:hypothetical protein